jgi:hypothetical protein
MMGRGYPRARGRPSIDPSQAESGCLIDNPDPAYAVGPPSSGAGQASKGRAAARSGDKSELGAAWARRPMQGA